MTKKDYERAATIVQAMFDQGFSLDAQTAATAVCVQLFSENPRFNEARFRAACQPGANVKARPKYAKLPMIKGQPVTALEKRLKLDRIS